MEIDRFKNYDSDVRQLVLEFEAMQQRGQEQFFDVSELEIIIDYYLDTLDYDQMSEAVRYAEHLYPSSNVVRLRRAYLYSVNGQYDAARGLLRKLESLEPENTDVQYALGALYSAIGQPSRAISYFEKAAADGYQLDVIYANIGDEYYRLGSFAEAESCYKKSLTYKPDDERVLLNLCVSICSQLRAHEAVSYFSDMVQHQPYSSHGWFCLGWAYMYSNDHASAIDAFEYVLAINNRYFEAYVNIAECYRALGQHAKAVTYLRDSLECASNPAEVYYNIGAVYHDLHNEHTAAIYFRKAAELEPNGSENWMAIASCYSAMGDYGAAIEYANRAMAISPDASDYVWKTACIHDQFDHPDEADPLYRCAIELDPECDDNWLDYGDFLMRYDRFDEAIELLQEGMVNANDQFAFNQRLAICYYRTGRRNFLFNALWACMAASTERIDELLAACPAMAEDYDVLNIINSK